jgi:hypothetical protein
LLTGLNDAMGLNRTAKGIVLLPSLLLAAARLWLGLLMGVLWLAPVLLLRKTLTTDASVPKLLPLIYKTLLVPGLALLGVSEMMEGAPDGAT